MDTVVMLPEVWVPVVAAFVPILSSLAVKPEGSNAARAVIAVIAVAVLAVVTELTDSVPGDTVEALVSTFFVSLVSAVSSYAAFWKHLGINHKVAPRVGTSK